eukprot:762128-Hanusia_phi.AAC.16
MSHVHAEGWGAEADASPGGLEEELQLLARTHHKLKSQGHPPPGPPVLEPLGGRGEGDSPASPPLALHVHRRQPIKAEPSSRLAPKGPHLLFP